MSRVRVACLAAVTIVGAIAAIALWYGYQSPSDVSMGTPTAGVVPEVKGEPQRNLESSPLQDGRRSKSRGSLQDDLSASREGPFRSDTGPKPVSPPVLRDEKYVQLRALLEKRFAAESRDSSWSDEATARVADALIPKLPAGSELVDVDCRQSMCRLKASHLNSSNYAQFAQEVLALGRESDWPSGMLIVRDDEDPAHPETIAFLARPEHPLPSLSDSPP
jgi:hypothetical protein